MRWNVVAAVIALACTRANASDLIGGSPDAHDAVVRLSSSVGSCTGNYVAPGRILTAAHCVPEVSTPGAVLVGFAGPAAAAPTLVASTAVVRFDDGDPLLDLAIVEIDARHVPALAPIAVLPRHLALGPDDLGATVVLVGFGRREPPSGVADSPQRDGGASTLAELEPERATVVAGPEQARACFGDSGGPLLISRDGGEYLAGVLSTGAADCSGTDHYVRVDAGRGARFVEDETTALAASGGCDASGGDRLAGALLVLIGAVLARRRAAR